MAADLHACTAEMWLSLHQTSVSWIISILQVWVTTHMTQTLLTIDNLECAGSSLCLRLGMTASRSKGMLTPEGCRQQPLAAVCATSEVHWPWAAAPAASVTASAALFAAASSTDAASDTQHHV